MSGLTWSCGDSSVSAVDPDFVATGRKCGKKGTDVLSPVFKKKLFENLLSYAASLNSSERAGGGFVE